MQPDRDVLIQVGGGGRGMSRAARRASRREISARSDAAGRATTCRGWRGSRRASSCGRRVLGSRLRIFAAPAHGPSGLQTRRRRGDRRRGRSGARAQEGGNLRRSAPSPGVWIGSSSSGRGGQRSDGMGSMSAWPPPMPRASGGRSEKQAAARSSGEVSGERVRDVPGELQQVLTVKIGHDKPDKPSGGHRRDRRA